MPAVSPAHVAAYAAAVAVTATWSLSLRLVDRDLARWVSDWGLATVAVLAAASCARTARRAQGRVRSVWALLAASAGCWGGGMVLWSWYE
jgi:hypothetical protein